MKMQALLIILLYSLMQIDQITSHSCGIGFLNKPKRVLVAQENETKRSLQAENWSSLRIHLDYSLIENNIGKFLKQDVIDLKEKIMPKTKQVLEKLLKVKSPAGKLKLPTDPCDKFKVPDYLSNDGVDADVVIFVVIDDTGDYKKNGIEAAALHCFQDKITSRPIAGYIQYKPEINVKTQTEIDYYVWLAIHELTHVLVMNDSLYEDWVDSNMKPLGLPNVVGCKMHPSGKKMNFIKTKNVVQKGKEYFGCDSFEGLALEYNGGPGTAGAHWSKRIMNTDYMIGDSYGENLISSLTLAMFEDSGWYLPDYTLSNLFIWGRREGCNFLDQNIKCVDTVENSVTTNFKNEFCTNLDKPVCSASNIFRGTCNSAKYTKLLPFEQYFGNDITGGEDLLTDKCPIPVETKKDQNFYGGSCRVGTPKNINKFEKICPECACFLSNLKENNNQATPDFRQEKHNNKLHSNASTKEINRENTSSLRGMASKRNTNGDLTNDDLRTFCFEYTCAQDGLYVKVLGQSFKCQDNSNISVDGYQGVIQCPPSSVLCDSKYMCKFGCTNRYK